MPGAQVPRTWGRVGAHFAFAKDDGSLARATERCVGVGACRNTVGGVMCPSYRATGEEQHSTRGRAHLLWEMLAGALRDEGFQSHAVHEALDLCLSCKACKSECPVQVDMAAYKSEFLAQHYKGRLHPLHHYIFGFADRLARYGSLAPALTNAILTGPLTSPLIKRIAGVAQERQLPRLAPKSFQQCATNLVHKLVRCPEVPRTRGPEARDGDSHNSPSLARHLEQLLPSANPRRRRNRSHPRRLPRRNPARPICCGRPLYDFGLLRPPAPISPVLDRMAPQIDAGLPFIFLEPSCASVFKDELLELFPNDPRAKRLSEQVWLLADLLAAHAPAFRLASRMRSAARTFSSTATATTRRSSAARQTKSRFCARPAPRSSSSRPAAAAWPAHSVLKPTNSKSRRPSPTRPASCR